MLYLTTTLTSLVVLKIVADLGTAQLAAAVAGQRIYFVFQAVIFGLSAGTTAMVARAWGAKKSDSAIGYAHLSIKMGLWLSIVIALVLMAAAPLIASFFQLSGEARDFAIHYIRWLNLFNPAFTLFILLSAVFRAIGDARMPLYISLITNVLVILLSWLLTHGGAILPAFGIVGAALGSGAGYTIGAFIFYALWRSNRLRLSFHPSTEQGAAESKRLISIAVPAATEQCVMQGALIIFLWIVAQYGTAAFAAYGVGLGILSVTMVIGLGFSIACSALVGQHLGANNHSEAIATGYRTLRLTTFYMLLCGGIVIYFAQPIAELMAQDPEVVRLSVVFMVVLGFTQPLLAVEFSLGGAMRGAGDTRFPLISTLCGFVGVRLLLAYCFMLAGLSVEWVFAALIADYLVKAILLTWRYRSLRWLRTRELTE